MNERFFIMLALIQACTTLRNLLGKKEKFTAQLLNCVNVSVANNRDKYGKFAAFLFRGDAVINDKATDSIAPIRIFKKGG